MHISIYRTNKNNTSKQLLVSCLHIHQAYNMSVHIYIYSFWYSYTVVFILS